MKVIALTLCFVAVAVAQFDMDLQLKCTREEIGIRWPSYYSNSEYYICQREGGRQAKMQCPPGELFTFVLQVCTTPNRFIPPPPMEVLPTSSAPMAIQPIPEEPLRPSLPRPIHPIDHNPMFPPIIVDQHPPSIDLPENHPPMVTENELPAEIPEEEITGPPGKPSLPPLPGKPKPQLPSKKPADPAAPLPPTPAPTPPVVQVTQPPKKQGAKKPPALPNASKKQPPSPSGSASKKQPPKPNGKKAGPTPPSKA